MFYRLGKHIVIQVIALVLLFGWAAYSIVTGLTVCPADGQPVLYQLLGTFWSAKPVFGKISAILMLFAETWLIWRFYSTSRFSENSNFMPALFFLLLLNIGGFASNLDPAHVTVLFLTVIIVFNSKAQSEKEIVNNRIFTSGILTGIASLIDPAAIGLLLFMTMSLIAHHYYSKGKKITIFLFGLLFVFIYLFSIYFLIGRVPELLESFRNLCFFDLFRHFKELRLQDYIFAGYLVAGVLYIGIRLKLFYDNKAIMLRRHLVSLNILMFVTAAMILLSGLNFRNCQIYMTVPLSLFFSILTTQKSKFVFHDLLLIAFYALLLWV